MAHSSDTVTSNERPGALPPGKIILLNGASSSGKSSLATILQAILPAPFWHISIDHLVAANVLPQPRIVSGEFKWHELRPQFHRCLPAFALGGNNLIVEHIVETEQWMNRLLALLAGIDAGAHFYFAHSFAALDSNEAAATCSHGADFAAVIERNNIHAVQFHPEKSGDSGARVLQNFLRLAA